MVNQPLPAKYDFTIYRGDTRVWEHHFTDDPVPPATVGDPTDITDWVFLAQYRLSVDTAEVLAADDCEIIDGPGGILRRTLTHTEAAKITAPVPRGEDNGAVVWDLQATKPDGSVKTYLYSSRVVVKGDTSR